jgi:transcription initiation factor TFIIIB Brf1 subunit/transcription initiation factor TFIIB
MGKTFFAVSAAALIVACVGWAIPNTQARVAPAATVQLDPFEMMTKQMLRALRRLFLRVLTAHVMGA